MKRFAAKAPRSAKAQELLQNRDYARELFNAIKSLPPESPLQRVSVAGVSFRSEARARKVAAND